MFRIMAENGLSQARLHLAATTLLGTAVMVACRSSLWRKLTRRSPERLANTPASPSPSKSSTSDQESITDDRSHASGSLGSMSTNAPMSAPKNENLVVNYHFLRTCNYSCKFCFHTAKTSHVVDLDDAKRGLELLKQYGMTRVNFSGGEPFLKYKMLGEMVKFCKEDLGISTSIVSNGSKISERWFKTYGQHLDVLAISCDSFVPNTLEKIGRGDNKQESGLKHIDQLKRVRSWCEEFDVKFKINTVVCTPNKLEDMSAQIGELRPCRWKVFQCLLIDGENSGEDAIRDAKAMAISDEEFDAYIQRNKDSLAAFHLQHLVVPENNDAMRNSYLILDEYMRFLNNTTGKKVPTVSILDDIQTAFRNSGFDIKTFKDRTGEWFDGRIAKLDDNVLDIEEASKGVCGGNHA